MRVEQLLLHPGTQQSPDVLAWLNEKMNFLHGSPRADLLFPLGWERLMYDEESEKEKVRKLVGVGGKVLKFSRAH